MNDLLDKLTTRVDALERADRQTDNALGATAEALAPHAGVIPELLERVAKLEAKQLDKLAAESAAAFALMRTEIEELKTAANQATEAKLRLEERLDDAERKLSEVDRRFLDMVDE